jgi:acyl transferase domain-containing protein/acyl carrier protein
MTFAALGPIDPVDVAVIGLAGRFPGAADVEQFWANLCGGIESIRPLSPEDTNGADPQLLDDPAFVRACSTLDGVEYFDAGFFGYSPNDARLMDPQSRVFLECAWHAFESAGYDPWSCEAAVGVYASQALGTYLLGHVAPHLRIDEFTLSSGNLPAILANGADFLPTRVSYKLRLRGPSVNVQTACSSSLVAIHLARQAVLSGECDMALAGGVSIYLPQNVGYRYVEGNILSRDGHCRPFDRDASGTVFGRGAGVVLLKPLAKAVEDGDVIRAVIKGSAVNNDGWNRAGYTAPGIEGQARVVGEALANAGIAPSTIRYVEAHGTGTAQGDPIEITALTQAFGDLRERGFCAIGSLKSNVGHLDIASGVAGFIKTALIVERGQLPPTLHYQSANALIDFASSPFYVNTQLRDWPESATPRRAGVSAFGMGGTNAHVVLEQPPRIAPAAVGVERPVHLLMLSARTETALRSLAARYAVRLDDAAVSLPDVCFTANSGRAHFEHRLALQAESISAMREALGVAASGGSDPTIARGFARGTVRTAWLFTGQGAQYAGMAKGLYDTQPTFRRAFDACEAGLGPLLERPLTSVVFGADATLIDETAWTQPAIFAVEYALAELWRSWGVRPAAVLGHSIGELTAACVAGVFSLQDALTLVAERARLMQALPRDGAMAAVRGDLGAVQTMVDALGGAVAIAAVNGRKDVVISGPRDAVAAASRELEAGGHLVTPLRVSHAFHSSLLDPMLDRFERTARDIEYRPPAIPLVSNLTGQVVSEHEVCTPRYWRRQARETVRFADGLDTLAALGHRAFLEIGPHPTLSALGRQHLGDGVWATSLRRGRGDWTQMASAIREMYVAGVEIDWRGFDADYPRRRVVLPSYPFERQRHWIEREPSRSASAPASGKPRDAAGGSELYRLRWEPRPGSTHADTVAAPRTWVVLADDQGIGASLASRLASNGHTVVVVQRGPQYVKRGDRAYEIGCGDPQQFTELFRSVAADHPGQPVRVVHLWAIDANPDPGDRLDAELVLTCASPLHLVQGILQSGQISTELVAFVTRQAQAVAREPVNTTAAPLLGLVRSVAAEYPHLRAVRFDLDASTLADSGELLARELNAGVTGDDEVAFRRGERFVPALQRCDEPAQRARPACQADGTYLITGGTGALGLKVAQWLAAHGAKHLVLMSRSGASPTAADAIARMAAAGTDVHIARGDVARFADVESVLTDIAATASPLRGIVHAAGVLDGGLLLELPWSRMAAVLRPKVHGAWNLHRLTERSDLDFFVSFSSIASVTGLVGHGNYAAANAFLDALAHRRRVDSLPALTINWGPWADDGMAARLSGGAERAHYIGKIDGDAALTSFGRLLQDEEPQAVALRIDWDKFARQRPTVRERALFEPLAPATARHGELTLAAPATARVLDRLAAAPPRARNSMLLSELETCARHVLGFAPDVAIEDDRPLQELGLDSLQALELRAALSTLLARPLPSTLLFDYPTLAQLAAFLLRYLGFTSVESTAADGGREAERERQVAELQELSEEEVEALLASELEAAVEDIDVNR